MSDWEKQWLSEADQYNEIRIIIRYKTQEGYDTTQQIAISKNIPKPDAMKLIDELAKAVGIEIKWAAKLTVSEEKEIKELEIFKEEES